MMSAVCVQRLSLVDMDRVATVHRAAFDARLPWLAGRHTPAEDRAFFRNRVFETCELWGAFQGRSLTGFIAFREGWIDQLYVHPMRQGRGHGGALLRLAQAVSATLLLWTFQRNAPARAFYERHGFAAVRQTDGRDNEEREPDVLYCWDRG